METRRLLVRRKARLFALEVKKLNLALKLGDEIIDWLKDDEIQDFKDHLSRFGLVQRDDFLWEAR